MLKKLRNNRFLFSCLVKRDFALKYKRTVLGMVWSALSPLFNLLIMWLVMSNFFGSNINHYAIYLFSGQIVYSYFCDATNQGMTSLIDNAGLFTKVCVPKYLFLLSKNVSSLISFVITFVLLLIFSLIDGLPITWEFLLLLYPITMLLIFNVGVGLILSALVVFFRDMQYLWGIFTQLIMWLSTIFYTIDVFPQRVQDLFMLNPVFLFISYFRSIVIDGAIPSNVIHLLIALDTAMVVGVGSWFYKRYNHQFLYYV